MDAPVYHYILDRIESSAAHLETEDGLFVTVSSDLLPAGAREGQVLSTSADPEAVCEPGVTFTITRNATRERQDRSSELRSGMKRGPEGDIDL